MARKLTRMLLTAASSLALLVAIQSVSTVCFWFYHQPDVPVGLNKFEN